MSRTVRGKVAVVGIGETQYYKRGEAPDAEFKLALKAILAVSYTHLTLPTKA